MFRLDTTIVLDHSSPVGAQGYQRNMYAFNSRREGNLTCRHWLLDPAGCRNNQCRYSHTITGAMSPPSMFACYAYNNGGCRLTQDQCLFAHLISGPESQYLQIRRESCLSVTRRRSPSSQILNSHREIPQSPRQLPKQDSIAVMDEAETSHRSRPYSQPSGVIPRPLDKTSSLQESPLSRQMGRQVHKTTQKRYTILSRSRQGHLRPRIRGPRFTDHTELARPILCPCNAATIYS